MSTAGTVPTTAKRNQEKRPQPKGGSRKGCPNKVNKEIKDLIIGALDQAGGVKYLVERAKDPRTASAFLGLVGKVLPLQVQGPGPNGEHGVVVRVEFVGPGS